MSDTYTYTQVTKVTPRGGSVAGGQSVTITGFGFDFATGGVTFGGVAATSIVIVSNTSITAVTPEHSNGAVDVVVAGVGTGASLYTYQLPNTIELPRVPVADKQGGKQELDPVGIVKWLMEVKQRLEATPVIDSGSIVGGAPLTRVNDTNVTLTLSGTPESALLRAVTLTLGWIGALSAARGGTGIQTYAVGDLLYASNSITLSKLADVSVGSYLRSGGVATAPLWSTLKLPNAATTGDLLYASASNTISNLLDVAAGSYLRSGGVATAPVWSTLTLPNSAATGDLLYGSAANTLSLRTIGSSGDVLTPSGGLPVWSPLSGLGTGNLTRVDDTNVTLVLGGTPTGALFKSVSLTLGWTGVLGVTRGGTGTGTTFTQGSVVFAGASGVYTQDNANFFWDDSNNFLGIGTNNPGVRLHILGSVNTNIKYASSGTASYMQFLTGSTTSKGFIGYDSGGLDFINAAGTTTLMLLTDAGRLAISSSAPTAWLHIRAGTTLANSAPLKFTSGSLLTSAEAGAVEFLTDDYYATITTGAARKGIVLNDGTALTSGRVPFATTNGRLTDDADLTFATDTLTATKLSAPTSVSTGTLAQTGKTTTYNNIATAGWGVEAIYAAGRPAAGQTAAVASVATYTLGAADGSMIVSANVNVTTSTTHNFTVAVDYTDETNTAQTLTLTFSQLAGVLVTAITNVTGAGPYEGIPLHIRCKASTAVTVKTVGTFTTVTYNVEGNIRQVA